MDYTQKEKESDELEKIDEKNFGNSELMRQILEVYFW